MVGMKWWPCRSRRKIELAKPSGLGEGDVISASFHTRTDVKTTITPPEGWTRTGWSSWEKTVGKTDLF